MNTIKCINLTLSSSEQNSTNSMKLFRRHSENVAGGGLERTGPFPLHDRILTRAFPTLLVSQHLGVPSVFLFHDIWLFRF